MYVFLTGGFLGSGKTTFIRRWGAFLAAQNLQVIIIENEVGQTGIDDQLLSSKGFLVREITGGCICCQLTGELTLAVNEIAAGLQPDFIVIETTGIAKIETIVQTLQQYGPDLDGIYAAVLVDAGRWAELYEIMPELITSQTAAANLLVVNKIDEVGHSTLDDLCAQLREINAKADIILTSALQGIPEKDLRRVLARVTGSIPDA